MMNDEARPPRQLEQRSARELSTALVAVVQALEQQAREFEDPRALDLAAATLAAQFAGRRAAGDIVAWLDGARARAEGAT